MKKLLRRLLLATLVVLLAIQLVPYGRGHTNPPTRNEPRWNSPRTRELAARTCFDCHSNETEWPWYTNVAPVSWLVQRDVDEGRAALNFSEGARGEAEEAAEVLAEGEMPPWFYLPLHAHARLSPAEKRELIDGLVATFGGEAAAEGRADGADSD
ncbi:MAG: heme-binding domain-containing protein [Planctomycetes bacterium]|nr:heme-binding domain-containing protein [Planctomycetota bacterium]